MGPLSLAAVLGIATARPRPPALEWPLDAVERRLDEQSADARDTLDRLRDRLSPRSMPAYYQDNPDWASIPYAHGGTIEGNGCGLAVAAMSLEWWTREQWTPARLAAEVGDSCTVGGLNYMPAFADFARSLGLSTSEQYWDIRRAVADARAGRTVWCAGGGRLGARSYGGHLVLLWRDEAGSLRINDPACPENTRAWTEEEILGAGGYWTYSISVWKEF